MKINKRVQLFLLLLLLLLYSWNIITDTPKQTDVNYNISVIIRGRMDESWSNIKKGAENAAEDLNVTLRFVAALDGNTAEEQAQLLEQEVKGTDAIIISPVNRILLNHRLIELSKKKPVVLMESGISRQNTLTVISSDNFAMGETLAETVEDENEKKKTILVISGNAMCTSVVDRQRGFMSWMEDTKNECHVVSAGNFEAEGIYTMMKEKRPNVVVALDTKLLENLVKANAIYKREFPDKVVSIYGYGCSNAVLKSLENGDINAITVDDGFSIGYLCVQEAVHAIENRKTKGSEEVRYVLTNSENMYSEENQKILFPFVK